MRVVLVLIIGGCVVWLVAQGARDAQGADRAAEDSARSNENPQPAGYLLPSVRLDEADGEPTTPTPEPAQLPRTLEQSSRSTTAETTPSPPTGGDAAPNASPIAGAEAPADQSSLLQIAAALAHRPASVPEFIATRVPDLRSDRKDFVMACVHLNSGDRQRAGELADKLRSAGGQGAAATWILDEALSGSEPRSLSSVPRADSIVFAGWIALRAAEAERALEARRYRESALAFSDVLQAGLEAPWEPERSSLRRWSDGLRSAQAHHRWSPHADWPSEPITVLKGDSLIGIRKRVLAQHPQVLVCTGMIERANDVVGSVLQPGQTLRIPTDRARVLVDLSAHWAVYILGDEAADAWEVGVGGAGSETRPGDYFVGDKGLEPMWFPPGKSPVPFGDPANPLGTRWIAWTTADGATTRLGFHGTNDPSSIGQDLSQGCIRMRNADVEELFEILPKGAAIAVRP